GFGASFLLSDGIQRESSGVLHVQILPGLPRPHFSIVDDRQIPLAPIANLDAPVGPLVHLEEMESPVFPGLAAQAALVPPSGPQGAASGAVEALEILTADNAHIGPPSAYRAVPLCPLLERFVFGHILREGP